MIKKLIRRLLQTRTTPEEAGHSAMPSTSGTTLLANQSTDSTLFVREGVASADGYLALGATNLDSTAFVNVAIKNGPTMTLSFPFMASHPFTMVPIGKGYGWTVTARSVKEVTMILVHSIGGGIIKLLGGLRYA